MVQWYPHGVVGEILPWNGPFMMGCQKICAILAAGNTAIIKPSSWASLSMLLLAEVFDCLLYTSFLILLDNNSVRLP